ncbi:unnamed protein product [Urochloa humidicola]
MINWRVGLKSETLDSILRDMTSNYYSGSNLTSARIRISSATTPSSDNLSTLPDYLCRCSLFLQVGWITSISYH